MAAWWRNLRPAEWVLVIHFVYVSVVAPFYPLRPQVAFLPPLIAATVFVTFAALAAAGHRTGYRVFPIARDLLAMAFTLTAYREMDWFTPAHRDHHLELGWIQWDRWLLYDAGFQHAIEAAGSALPSLLELCYLVVYAVAPFSVAVVYALNKEERAGTVLFFYLLSTLLAYACFPYFPSEPPRTVFPGQDLPQIANWVRRSNLLVVGGYGIHSSVFPSAHVSSAFGAAFGMCYALPERPWWGRGLLIYACLVTLATVYGRYHYAVDAVGGVVTSLAGLIVGTLILRRLSVSTPASEPASSLR